MVALTRFEFKMNFDHVEDWIQCACCSIGYAKEGERAPHLLICGHSICCKDVKNLNESKSNIIGCPVCKRKTGLHLYKDNFPPRNFAITEQLDKMRAMVPEPTNCQECQKQVCTVYCKECKIDLCDECNTSIHRMRVFATHARIPIVEKSPLPAEQMYCSIHENEPLRLFCLEDECRRPSCFLCATHGIHKGHNVSLIAEAAPTQKEIFEKEVLAACTNARKGMQDITNKLFYADQNLQVNRELYLQALREDFAVVRQVLNLLEQQLLEYVNHEAAELSKDISSLQIELSGKLAEMRAIEFLGKITLSSEPTLFLSKIRDLSETMISRTTKTNDCLNRVIVPSVDIKYIRDEKCEVLPGKEHAVGVLAKSIVKSIRGFSVNNLKVTASDELIVSGFVELDCKNAYEFSAVIVKSGGILTVKGWDGNENTGYLNLIVSGNVIVEEGGQINLTGRGYRGGASCGISERSSSDGESPQGCAGKGGKASARFGSTGGGGGGLGTNGFDADPNRFKEEVHPGGVGGKKLQEKLDRNSMLARGSGGGKIYSDCI